MDFLGEDWTQELLNHHKINHDYWYDIGKELTVDQIAEKHPFRHSPRKPVFSSSVGNWKKNLNILEKVFVNIYLGKNLEKLNYK